MTEITVTQADRDAAALLAEWHTNAAEEWGRVNGTTSLQWFAAGFPDGVRRGVWDKHPFVEAFAKHRQSSTEEVERLREDAELLNALRENSWDLRSFDMPTGGGDADIGWRVVGHWMAEPRERVVAEVYIDDPRVAIRTALTGASTHD